jgi:hypothetical protein
MKTIDAEKEIPSTDEATRIAREKLVACLGELMELALKVCMGIKRKKFYPLHILEQRLKTNPKARDYYFEIEYDPAMIRFLLERFIPPAKTAMDLNVKSPEEFDRAIEQARERAFRQNPN